MAALEIGSVTAEPEKADEAVLKKDQEVEEPMEGVQQNQNEAPSIPPPVSSVKDEAEPLSKNAMKRLRRQQKWEAGKAGRRERRKEKRHALKSRKREQREALIAQGIDPAANLVQKPPSQTVPVSLVLDCDFEKYMTDKERISLASQLTRCYSDNRQARYRVHMWMAGLRGKLLERFENVLDNQHKNWKGVRFAEGDFVECSELSQKQLAQDPGVMIESLQQSLDEEQAWTRDETDPIPMPDDEPEQEPSEEHRNIVYLTADSPYTLQRLEPNTSYIIGGLVDKNREKGLCYKLARRRAIRTARLPIGQFLAMQSRKVLTTNHVVEIMLKWLEYGDWGRAFLDVIPKRKGGTLIGAADGADGEQGGEEEDEEDEEDEDEGPVEEAGEEHSRNEASQLPEPSSESGPTPAVSGEQTAPSA